MIDSDIARLDPPPAYQPDPVPEGAHPIDAAEVSDCYNLLNPCKRTCWEIRYIAKTAIAGGLTACAITGGLNAGISIRTIKQAAETAGLFFFSTSSQRLRFADFADPVTKLAAAGILLASASYFTFTRRYARVRVINAQKYVIRTVTEDRQLRKKLLVFGGLATVTSAIIGIALGDEIKTAPWSYEAAEKMGAIALIAFVQLKRLARHRHPLYTQPV